MFSSCQEPDQLVEPTELLTDQIDFTEEEIVDIIRMNFLADNGGIEKERQVINNISLNEFSNVDIDTLININIQNASGTYQLNITGDFKSHYSSAFNVYNDRFISYHDEKSVGMSSLGKFKLGFNMQTALNIAGNVDDEVYVYFGNTTRSLEFLEGLNVMQAIGGSIRFSSNNCPFDYFNNTLSNNAEYTVDLRLYNQDILGDRVDIEGLIDRQSGAWVLTLTNGNTYGL